MSVGALCWWFPQSRQTAEADISVTTDVPDSTKPDRNSLSAVALAVRNGQAGHRRIVPYNREGWHTEPNRIRGQLVIKYYASGDKRTGLVERWVFTVRVFEGEGRRVLERGITDDESTYTSCPVSGAMKVLHSKQQFDAGCTLGKSNSNLITESLTGF